MAVPKNSCFQGFFGGDQLTRGSFGATPLGWAGRQIPILRALALLADQAKPPWTLGSYIQHGTWAGRRNFTTRPRTEGVVSVTVRRGKLKVVTPERSKGVAQEAMKKLLFQVKVD